MSPSRISRGVAAGAVAAGAALSFRALARPLPTSERRLLDWDEVRRIAHARTRERGGGADPTGALGARYTEMARELFPLMEEVWGPATATFPGFTAIDRRGFVDGNILIAQRLFAPVERLRATLPESRVTAFTRTAASRYIGEMFGFLSSRVLGQYDPVLLLAPAAGDAPEDAPSLYLVEPNVERFARTSGVDGDHLRRWLVLHEVTHAWQFEAHPWLRTHIGALMHDLLMNDLTEQLAAGAGRSRPPKLSLDTLLSLPGTVRAQLRGAQRIQAIMSVAEGYSNFVMHRVGRAHLADFDALEAAFHRRSSERPLLERLVLAVTGMNLKLRQYEVGERFADAVTARGGYALLNRVWEGPELMPSPYELDHPDAWIRRAG